LACLSVEPLHAIASAGEQDNGILGFVDGHAVLLLQYLQILDHGTADASLPHQTAIRGAPGGDAASYCADDGVLLVAGSEVALTVGLGGKVLPPHERAILGVDSADCLIL
jgi:hypothetical protein